MRACGRLRAAVFPFFLQLQTAARHPCHRHTAQAGQLLSLLFEDLFKKLCADLKRLATHELGRTPPRGFPPSRPSRHPRLRAAWHPPRANPRL